MYKKLIHEYVFNKKKRKLYLNTFLGFKVVKYSSEILYKKKIRIHHQHHGKTTIVFLLRG